MHATDYVSLIEMLLARIGARTARERAVAYQRAQSALKGTLDKIDPPMSARERNGELRKLSGAIRLVEAQRSEAEKAAAEQAEQNPASSLANLRFPSPDGEDAVASAGAPGDVVLRPLLPVETPPVRTWKNPGGVAVERVRVVAALVMRQMHLAMSRDRSYYLWLIVETFLQIGLIIFGYWLLGHEFVLDMPAAVFAIVGASAWLMFRTTIRMMLVSESMAAITQFPKVFYIDVLVSQAIFVGIFYLLIVAVFLAGVDYFGYVFHVESVLAFIVWWFALWLLAFGTGLACAGLSLRATWGRRFVQIAVRMLVIFSGVAFVTEQLPLDYKVYFLWSPVLHAIQSLRDALLVEYDSVDADAFYFFAALVLVLAFGLAMDRSARLRKFRL